MFIVESKSKKKITLKYFREIEDGEGRAFDQFFSQFDGQYEEILILWHCYGGIVFEGNLMYNILKDSKSIVNIDIVGVAASMGAVLLKSVRGTKANPKGKVRIARNGFVMLHRVKGGAVGTADDMREAAKLMDDMETTFKEDLADSTGMTEDEVYDKWFKDGADHWLNADEACNVYHLVDEVIDPIVKNITNIDTTMAAQLGAKAMYGKFAAYLEEKQPPENIEKPNLNNDTMKAELIAKYNLQGVTADSSNTAIMEAIDAKFKSETDKAEKAQKELKDIKDKEITSLVDAAAIEGKIKAKEGQTLDQVKATYVSIGKSAGVEALKTALDNAQPHQTITSKIKTGGGQSTANGGSENKDKENWTWKEWQENAAKNKAIADELEQMPENNWEKFNELYRSEFGKDAPKN